MSIGISTSAYPSVVPRADAAAAAVAVMPSTPPGAPDSRAALNASILEATFSLSDDPETRSLALLFRSAIDNINELLRPELGENALQHAMDQDNTPAGTAGRIVSISTGFFEAYKLQHPGEDEASLLKDFMATILRGFEQGYGEAKNLLSGLGVLNGDIAGNIEKTRELVLQGYADFEARIIDGTSKAAMPHA